MKKILLAALLSCLVILTANCGKPKEAPPIPHDFKISGSIQEVFVQPGIDCLLSACPTVTAFSVKTEDTKIHMVALRGDRTAEIMPSAKIELVYNDLWLVAKRWTTITDEKGYKFDIWLFYYAATQYKILESAPVPQPANPVPNPSAPKEAK
ncbi:MAG: hypothetical protein AAB568_01235 [Patescibacteria group bacterium]